MSDVVTLLDSREQTILTIAVAESWLFTGIETAFLSYHLFRLVKVWRLLAGFSRRHYHLLVLFHAVASAFFTLALPANVFISFCYARALLASNETSSYLVVEGSG